MPVFDRTALKPVNIDNIKINDKIAVPFTDHIRIGGNSPMDYTSYSIKKVIKISPGRHKITFQDGSLYLPKAEMHPLYKPDKALKAYIEWNETAMRAFSMISEYAEMKREFKSMSYARWLNCLWSLSDEDIENAHMAFDILNRICAKMHESRDNYDGK